MASHGLAAAFIATIFYLGSGKGAAAQAPSPATPQFGDRATGDWGGLRTRMAQRGITLDRESTHFTQDLVSGTGNDGFDYGGRADAFLNFDTRKLGLWKGGIIRTHTEFRYAGLSPNLGGVLLSSSLGVTLPLERDRVVVSSIHLVQQLGARMGLVVGKINAVDLLANDPFFGGAGTTRFFNLAFAAPPSGVTPPVIMGGILTLRTAPLAWTLMVYDPDDRTDDYWPSHLFGNGVGMTLSATRGMRIAGRTSSITLSGTYNTKDGANLGELLLPPELQTGTKKGSYNVSLQLSHFLVERGAPPGNGWGAFLKLGFSDGNPNPYQGLITGGIGGRGLIPSRPADTFGLGYFFCNFSDVLQSVILPFAVFRDEQGAEAFYSFAATPWLLLTADIQYLIPADGASDNAFVGGFRLRVRL